MDERWNLLSSALHLFTSGFLLRRRVRPIFSEGLQPADGCWMKLGQRRAFFFLFLSERDSWLSLTDSSTGAPSKDDGKALVRPPPGKAIS